MALLDTLGETQSFSELLARLGPFALLAFFLLVGVAYTVTEVKKATGATQKAFRKILVGEVVFVLALSVFAMYVWYKGNVTEAHIITGSIEGLRDELVVSDDLFLRPKLTTYEWKLITRRQLNPGDMVDIVIAPPQAIGLLPSHHNIKIKASFYDPDTVVRLVWRREEGRVFYLDSNEPLPVTGSSPAPAHAYAAPSWLPVVFAQSSGKFSREAVQYGVASSNPVVREQAIRQLASGGAGSVEQIRPLLKSSNPTTVAGAILGLNLMDAGAKREIREKKLLGDSAEAVVRAMGADAESVRNEAARCIGWYDPAQVVPVATKLLASASTDQRLLGVRILDKSGRAEAVPILQKRRAAERDAAVLKETDRTLATLQNLEKSAAPNVAGRRKQAIDLALELKKKSVPFKWGGRSEAEGFDSASFAAYVLGKAGVIQQPEKYWSGSLRKAFPETKSPEPGDVIFYDLGYVGIYLGSDTCVAMLPSGVATQPVNFGPRVLGYGKVPY